MHSLNTISFSFGFCLISGIVISFHGARADTIRVAACRAARFPISGALTTLFVVPNINYFRRSGQRGCVSLQYLPLPSSADCLQRAVFGVLGVIKRWGGGGATCLGFLSLHIYIRIQSSSIHGNRIRIPRRRLPVSLGYFTSVEGNVKFQTFFLYTSTQIIF